LEVQLLPVSQDGDFEDRCEAVVGVDHDFFDEGFEEGLLAMWLPWSRISLMRVWILASAGSGMAGDRLSCVTDLGRVFG
jgi:hypothetical protein